MPGVDKDWNGKIQRTNINKETNRKSKATQSTVRGAWQGVGTVARSGINRRVGIRAPTNQPVIELPKMVFHVADTWEITQKIHKYINTRINKFTNT